MTRQEATPSFSTRRILTNVGALFSGTTVARVLSALSIFIIARQLGPEEFGVYTALISLAKLTAVFFTFGLDSWLLRNGRRFEGGLAGAGGLSLSIKLVLGVVWLIALRIIAPLLNQDAFPQSLLLLGAVSVWLEEIANIAWSVFKTALRNRVTAWLVIGMQVLFLLFTIALVRREVTATEGYLWARIGATAVSGALSVALMVRTFGFHVNVKQAPTALRASFPFGLSHGLAVVYERADITLIAHWLGKMATGLYAPAVSLMTTLFLAPLAIYEVMLPTLSQAHAVDAKLVQKLGFRLFLLSAGLGVALGVAMTLLAYPLVWLVYGAEFMFSAQILTILSNVLVFKCISFALAAVIAAVGWQSRRVWVQAAAAIFNIAANILLIRQHGIIGVAYIYVLTEAVLMGGYLYLLLRWQRENDL